VNKLEIEFISFQRVREYAQLPAEEKPHRPKSVPISRPPSGAVEFRTVTTRYTHDGPDILKHVSFTLRPRERVAIVGRTGSGKSTLALSFLRVTHVVSGSILYDGIDITHLSLPRLCQSLTIILQDTVLLEI
jgi:ABC-type multidrug transport system fused ATPase/permease subunit